MFQCHNFREGNCISGFYLYNRRSPEGIRRQVVVTFVIEKDGSLTEIKVLRGLTKEADEEAIRVLKASPKWQPGSQNGKIIRVAYTMPINFGLLDSCT